MSLSQTFRVFWILTLSLFCLIGYSSYRMNLADSKLLNAIKNQRNLELIGHQLATGSDYLTNEIRKYTQFGDELHFDNFWKEVRKTKSREVLDELVKLKALPSEMEIIKKSKSWSNDLIKTEQQAMEAVKKGDLNEARKLVFGEKYEQQKSLIMGNIRKFQQAVQTRTRETVSKAQKETELFMIFTNFLMLISGALILLFLLHFAKKRVIVPIGDLAKGIKEVSINNLDVQVPEYEFRDEIKDLAQSFNRMIRDLRQSRMNEESLLDREKVSNLLRDIASVSNNARNKDDLVKGVLVNISKFQNWPVAHAIFVEEGEVATDIISSKIWYLENEEEFLEFKQVTERTNFKSSIGLPGRVYAQNKLIWVDDIESDANFPRKKQLSLLNLKSAFAFPLFINGKIATILEFYSRKKEKRDNRFLENMEQVAAHISVALERKELELNLIEEKSRTQSILENVVDAIITINQSGYIKTVNKAAEKIFGYSPNEVIGKNVCMLMPEPFRSEHDKYLKNYIQTGNARVIGIGQEVVGLRKNCEEFPMDIDISEGWMEDQRIFIGIVRDISERKRNEDEIKSLSAYKDSILREAQTSIITTDLNGVITTFNESAERMLGYSAEEMIGKKTPEIFHDKEEVFQRSRELSNKYDLEFQPGFDVFVFFSKLGESETREWTYIRKDGTRLPVLLSVSPLRDDDDKLIGYLGIGTDLTERKREELAILKAREDAESANKAKSIFLTNMSHEIRTPMNAVLGYSQILLRNKNLDEDTRKSIQTIDRSSKKLLALINEILDISKNEAGKTFINESDFDLKEEIELLANMFKPQCDEKKVIWSVQGFNQPVKVIGDETKLHQILVNLLGNAVKFTEKGEVSLAVSPLGNDLYRFDIKDTGPGISTHAQKTIFDVFTQDEEGSKKGGTGLGLAIAKKHLEFMNSKLNLSSVESVGTHIHFTVSLLPGKKEQEDHFSSSQSIVGLVEGVTVKVLVVDDLMENRDVLSGLLSNIGAEVFEAENGEKAIEIVHAQQLDIVFLDIRMPNMRGEEVLETIRKDGQFAELKIVAITASAIDRPGKHFLDIGFDEYITKPFFDYQVFGCLKKLLGVEFEYEEIVNDNAISDSMNYLDWSQCVISKDLLNKLENFASLYNITELENSLMDLEQREGVHEKYCAQIKNLINRYDMDGLIHTLRKVSPK